MPELERLYVESKVREALKAKEVNIGGDALPALNKQIHALIDAAVARAQANNRKTVRAIDF